MLSHGPLNHWDGEMRNQILLLILLRKINPQFQSLWRDLILLILLMWILGEGQTFDPNKTIHTQNPSGAIEFIAPKYAEPQAPGVESSNQQGYVQEMPLQPNQEMSFPKEKNEKRLSKLGILLLGKSFGT